MRSDFGDRKLGLGRCQLDPGTERATRPPEDTRKPRAPYVLALITSAVYVRVALKILSAQKDQAPLRTDAANLLKRKLRLALLLLFTQEGKFHETRELFPNPNTPSEQNMCYKAISSFGISDTGILAVGMKAHRQDADATTRASCNRCRLPITRRNSKGHPPQ